MSQFLNRIEANEHTLLCVPGGFNLYFPMNVRKDGNGRIFHAGLLDMVIFDKVPCFFKEDFVGLRQGRSDSHPARGAFASTINTFLGGMIFEAENNVLLKTVVRGSITVEFVNIMYSDTAIHVIKDALDRF